jgi:MoxR-like ATPase
MSLARPDSIEATLEALDACGYVAERELATTVFLALRLERPLLVEGEPGVGKTEIAKALAAGRRSSLIRLQCYEGLDVAQAVYDWDYARQMLHIRLREASGTVTRDLEQEIYGPAFLRKRALLRAIEHDEDPAPVLLIDEIDRADEEFEAFLLELLSDWQITIPEIGTIRAARPPVVVITSNRTREVHDALKRRCLYQWIPYPSFDKELRIVASKVADLPDVLSRQIVAFVQGLRRLDLQKAPGIAETLDWAAAVAALGAPEITEAVAADTIGALVKSHDDFDTVRTRIRDLIAAQA